MTSQILLNGRQSLFFVEIVFSDGGKGFEEVNENKSFMKIAADLCLGVPDFPISRVIAANPMVGISADVSGDVCEVVCKYYAQSGRSFANMPENARDLCEANGFDVSAMIAEERQESADWTMHIRSVRPSYATHG